MALWGLRRVSLCGVLGIGLLSLVACSKGGGGDRVTNNNIFNVQLNGNCSVFFFDGGVGRNVTGSGGSTVTTGGTSFTFSQDCRSVIVSGATTPENVVPS